MESPSRTFSVKKYKILFPSLLGICVIVWMFTKEFTLRSFKNFSFGPYSVYYIVTACFLVAFRDFCMIARFRLLSEKKLTWRQTVKINLLREFSTAIMPSTVGGGGWVVLFLHKEGLSIGKSAAIAMISLFLDNVFFILLCPLLFLFLPLSDLFNRSSDFSDAIGMVFWIVFPALIAWTLLLYIGIFHYPSSFRTVFLLLFDLPVLRKFKNRGGRFSVHLVEASESFKTKGLFYWANLFFLTSGVWISRFYVAVVLFMAFTEIDRPMIIFGRQLVLWLSMVASPTPGGSGLSEISFREFYSDVNIGGGALIIIIALWRFLFYYAYLFAGAVLAPEWLNRLNRK